MKKLILIVLVLLVIVVSAAAIYLKVFLPDVGRAPDLKAASSPALVARGEYLANHVAVCMDCHSTRDWSRFSGPLNTGTLGKGGEYFGPEMGFPGSFYSKNITPYHLKDWTDGEIYRLITTGVSKDGRAIFPVMPYRNYRKLAKEDVVAIIAYLRTLKPIDNKTPDAVLDFPVNFLVNTIPQPAAPMQMPPKSDTIAYGAYLTSAAACIECHTPAEKGNIIPEKAFQGGREFTFPNGLTTASANLTPDPNTGIGAWTEAQFVARFKAYLDPANVPKLGPKDNNTIMPWTMYAGMDTTDLESIYRYLRTLKPVENKVVHFKWAVSKK